MLIKWQLESKQADETKQKIVMNEELLYGVQIGPESA